jgi:hypothetical protein
VKKMLDEPGAIEPRMNTGRYLRIFTAAIKEMTAGKSMSLEPAFLDAASLAEGIDLLVRLLPLRNHMKHEDIVGLLQRFKEPRTVDAIYAAAQWSLRLVHSPCILFHYSLFTLQTSPFPLHSPPVSLLSSPL